MSATDELGSRCEFVRNAQLRENCNADNPPSLAVLAGRARGHRRNIPIASFMRIRGR